MNIHTVVYVDDGVVLVVEPFTDMTAAQARHDGLLKKFGILYDDEPDDDLETIEMDGKTYGLWENDRLSIHSQELEDRKCVWIPDEVDISEKLGRPATEEEVVNVQHAFEKGIEGQVDWQMAFDFAIGEA